MPPNNWKQWLKLTKKQLKQLRRSLDDELQGLLERNLPPTSRSLVRIPVPVRQVYPVRNNYRNFSTTTRTLSRRPDASGKTITPNAKTVGGSFVRSSVLSNFGGMQRCPRGVPRGLFSNWNMTTAKYAYGRAYSTSAIKITHDAVQNMAISLRCFFNLWGDFLPSGQDSSFESVPLSPSYSVQQVGKGGASLLRDQELYSMIQQHKQEVPDEFQVEQTGCMVEFKLPELDLSFLPVMVFACEESMNSWTREMARYKDKLMRLEENVRKIYDQYGSLPLSFDRNKIRIHFPNLTVQETERLLRDASITLGIVLLESDILSETNDEFMNSTEHCLGNDSATEHSPYFPILSSASESEFSLISSAG